MASSDLVFSVSQLLVQYGSSGWEDKWHLRCAWLYSGLANMGKSRASVQELLTHSGPERPSTDAPYLKGTKGTHRHQHMVWWMDGISSWCSNCGSFGSQVVGQSSPDHLWPPSNLSCYYCMQQKVLQCLPHVPSGNSASTAVSWQMLTELLSAGLCTLVPPWDATPHPVSEQKHAQKLSARGSLQCSGSTFCCWAVALILPPPPHLVYWPVSW